MHWWKSFNSFSSVERKGIAGLLILALLLLLSYATMQYWASLKPGQTDPELIAAFKQYKQAHASGESASESYAAREIPAGELFLFDPNTLDSTGFIRLGLRPVTTRMLLNWRRKGKLFYKKEDLKPLYTLKEEEYQRLAPYISITPPATHQNTYASIYRQEPLPDHIDLNTTDSATIVRLNGIGPTLAHKIIQKRNALGGFLKHDQLNEIYRFPDTVFKMLRERLIINPNGVKKLRLNTATVEDMKTHPYIGEKLAKNIVLFREGLIQYERVEQLRQVPLMNEDVYRKISPYFSLD